MPEMAQGTGESAIVDDRGQCKYWVVVVDSVCNYCTRLAVPSESDCEDCSLRKRAKDHCSLGGRDCTDCQDWEQEKGQ